MTIYTNAQFRSILFGLGYLAEEFANPAFGFPYTTDDSPFTGYNTLQAIKTLQVDYGLEVDGIVGVKTMAKAEEVILTLQYQLNIVVNADIPKNQPFYGPKTVQAVKKFEAQYYGLEEQYLTGVANLDIRRSLDAIAKQTA